MPDEIVYDETKRRLTVGKGYIDNVPAADVPAIVGSIDIVMGEIGR